ncbi:MAG: hypothetical protein ABSB95_00470 [Dissulfurispiraceae bacterium]
MMYKKNNSAIFKVVLFFLSCQLFLILNSGPAAGSDGKPDCDINRGPCKKNAGSTEILFDILPKPVKAMQELNFTITIKGGPESDKLIVTLGMPDMYMGENKIIAGRSSKETYTGVETPKGEKADFLFNVIY